MNIVIPVSHILGFLVLVAQVTLVAGIIYVGFFRKRFPSEVFAKFIESGLLWAFLVSLVATMGSLFYSQIAKFTPCELCWFQRIFMYPQVVILGLALIKKERQIIDYSLALTGVGALISIYHNYIFYGGVPVTSCGITSAAASCTQKYIVEFGYITIPMMALTAFLSIIFILTSQKMQEKGYLSKK
jgi:disulfide bond formation protein DsbB